MKKPIDRVMGLLNTITLNRNNAIGTTIITLLFTDLILCKEFIYRMYGLSYTQSELRVVINLLEQEGKWN